MTVITSINYLFFHSHLDLPPVPVREAHLREAHPHVLPRRGHSVHRPGFPLRLRLPRGVAKGQLLQPPLVAGPGDNGHVRAPVRDGLLQVSLLLPQCWDIPHTNQGFVTAFW